MSEASEKDEQSQSDKFKDAARERGADEDEARWTERLKKIAVHGPPTDDIREKFSALLEQSKQVLRENGMSETEIEARIATGRKNRATRPAKPK